MPPRSMLQQLTREPIAEPCDTPWSEMEGDEKVRRCASCDRDVYALSAMTALEAELRLLNAPDALPCIRYARDAHGAVVHLAAAKPYSLSTPYARAFVAASALSVALAPAAAFAEGKPAKAASKNDGCVVFKQDAAAPIVASAAASNTAGAAAAPPAASPPASPAVPARAAAAAAPAAPPPEPMMMGGAPPPMQQRAEFGTLVVKSKIARDIKIASIALKAPLDGYLLTPGKFVIEVREPNGKLRNVKMTIKVDTKTTIDLDKR